MPDPLKKVLRSDRNKLYAELIKCGYVKETKDQMVYKKPVVSSTLISKAIGVTVGVVDNNLTKESNLSRKMALKLIELLKDKHNVTFKIK